MFEILTDHTISNKCYGLHILTGSTFFMKSLDFQLWKCLMHYFFQACDLLLLSNSSPLNIIRFFSDFNSSTLSNFVYIFFDHLFFCYYLFLQAMAYISIMVGTYGVSFFLMLALESPMISLEKLFLPQRNME